MNKLLSPFFTLFILGIIPLRIYGEGFPAPYSSSVQKYPIKNNVYYYTTSQKDTLQISMGWIPISSVPNIFIPFMKNRQLNKDQMDSILTELSNYSMPSPIYLHLYSIPDNLSEGRICIMTPDGSTQIILSKENIINQYIDLFTLDQSNNLLTMLAENYYKNIQITASYSYHTNNNEIHSIDYDLSQKTIQELKEFAFFAHHHLTALYKVLDTRIKTFNIQSLHQKPDDDYRISQSSRSNTTTDSKSALTF